MHIAVLITCILERFSVIAICRLHPLWWPLCYSPWSYVIALGWLKCRLLSKEHCSSQAFSLCQGLWSCVVSQRTGLLMNSDLAWWVLPGLLAKKMLLLMQGTEDCKRGHWGGQGSFLCQSHLHWPKVVLKPVVCCQGKGNSCCAWEFTCGKKQPVSFRATSTGLSWAQVIWVNRFPYHFIHSGVFFVAQKLG